MPLAELAIANFRNIPSIQLPELSGTINCFYGANGSGKTSVLEAIHMLSTGRSFRTHKIKTVIGHNTPALTVFGRVAACQVSSKALAAQPFEHHSLDVETPIGIQRDASGGRQIKVAGQPAKTSAQLAQLLPLQVLEGHLFELLEGAPSLRRQHLDWLVFHVEHDFLACWKDVQRCIKQRNSMLRRDKIDRLEMRGWDQELYKHVMHLHQLRDSVFQRYCETFESVVAEVVNLPLRLEYRRGWDMKKTFQQVLEDNFSRDQQLGYTQSGPHRADIKVFTDDRPASEVLSRGQQKIVVTALKVASALALKEATGRSCTFLVDDLPAELDAGHREMVAHWIDQLGAQAFITGVEREPLAAPWVNRKNNKSDIAMFHVEHGNIIRD